MDPGRPAAGRLLRADVDAFLEEVWRRVPALLAEDDLRRIPGLGNRHNVFLGALTVAAWGALLERGIERRYAIELFADVGWKLYERMLGIPFTLARLGARDPQRRMDLALQLMMRFPFSAPGRPGYEVRAWSEPGRFLTHWTYCAPLGFVRRHVERHGDSGELEVFRQSWCLYDWPAADILAGGRPGEGGHYERPHTLSHGDPVCDMCWSAAPRAEVDPH